MTRNSLSSLIAACFLICLAAMPANADERESEGILNDLQGIGHYDGSPMEGHFDLMSRKLMRGLTNVLTGFGEVPRQVKLATQEDHSAANYTRGGISGIGMSLTRTLVGVLETATFIMPAPDNFHPLLDPGVVWGQRQQTIE